MGHARLNITYYNDEEFKAEVAARAAKTVNTTAAGDRQQQ
jgi:sugar/nucleoside kinase (ribokinase family)